METVKGYMVLAFDHKSDKVDHVSYFKEKDNAFSHLDDCILDGFSVICEEARVLVSDLSDDFAVVKGVVLDTDCNH